MLSPVSLISKNPIKTGLASALVGAALLFAAPQSLSAQPTSFADLADELLPTVVNISTTAKREPMREDQYEEMFRDFFERFGRSPNFRQSSLGSGFIIDSKGLIVTNMHVIDGADEIRVVFQDNSSYDARVIGGDEESDLAVLEIIDPDRSFPVARWGDSDEARVGDWLMAIGNPWGYGGTVTTGIVSAKQRVVMGASSYESFIQTDAAINRGNSGGPSFNMEGEVIGVNTAIISPSGGSIGLGFAIPSNLARSVVRQLIEFGEVRRGWLGVTIQTVDEDLARKLKLPKPYGALVSNVSEGSPAEAAGVRSGDVIIRFDGQEVSAMRDLPFMVSEAGVGSRVNVTVWREGREVTLRARLGERNEGMERASGTGGERSGPPKRESSDSLGATLGELDDEIREASGIKDDVSAVVVLSVEPESPAASVLRPRDLILSIDQEPVASVDDVDRIVKSAKEQGFELLLLQILRNGSYSYRTLELEQ